MQISGSINLPATLLPQQGQRADIADRLQRDIRRDSDQDQQPRPARIESADDNPVTFARPIVSADETSRAENRAALNAQQEVDRLRQDSLPLSTRQALQTFAENTPSPEQRLGIELAGIDTFA